MAQPNPSRGEVALPFGDGSIILRCSYGALGKLLPLLLDAPPEVQAKRREFIMESMERFLQIQTARFGLNTEALARLRAETAIPTTDKMDWQHHVLGAVLAREVDTVATVVAICAEEHQPTLTAADVKRQSPHWGSVYRAFEDLARLTNWRPGEEPKAEEVEAVKSVDPFALARSLLALMPSRRRTGSAPPNSGA